MQRVQSQGELHAWQVVSEFITSNAHITAQQPIRKTDMGGMGIEDDVYQLQNQLW